MKYNFCEDQTKHHLHKIISKSIQKSTGMYKEKEIATRNGTDMRPGTVHIVFKCRVVAARAQCASNSLGVKAMRQGVRRPLSRPPVTRLCVDYHTETLSASGVYCVWLFLPVITPDCDLITTYAQEGEKTRLNTYEASFLPASFLQAFRTLR